MPYPNEHLPLGKTSITLTLHTHTHNHGKLMCHSKIIQSKIIHDRMKNHFFSLLFRRGVMKAFMKSDFLLAKMLVLFSVKSK